ncbi:PREDICTED: endoplasmic reticulum metallopeptidase 1 isoform X1 [Tarenaya hassleriana]|uniref:endoplasmic reticulum metallopeptidase 1 isoform X1 n=1 Tax=Tarenaya hassleriana TaxID=28532 RepID=UPI00053C9945|nr:PREDICTED: endoplasmic reticulum metallopeptidase 1 isoform X1 [Tarenaya hassleriana]XP_010558757.1 PREDICTED: endoplasmic reticulum metallopeptidase 1 isoform X2 [Tarenaya hassleriana]XP_010558758.1 PREDICTED: endoplasmic reticulum metallopeptidase 1 isoform X1 [Tarenaya hassleriana]XP_010558759.1 PREDICTED: endoplasmic reticulum metallopeptidase 1 isoform X1 [Tarenaya hassleriana]
MRKRHPKPSNVSDPSSVVAKESGNVGAISPRRSGIVWLALCLLAYSTWTVYNYQHVILPPPLSSEQAGKRGFSEVEAMKHVEELTQLGPHPVSSDGLDDAVQYVFEMAEKIKKTAHWEVDVDVELFQAKTGANRMVSGLFKGKTLAYSDLGHIIIRILPKYESDAGENAILVSSHIDTVFSTGGAGDCSSCVAVMLELARSLSQWAHGFKNSVIFLFNTGEEEGLSGAHSFITQHPLNSTIRLALDLEAMGVGGKSAIFQAGPDPWAIENFASVAKYPSGQIIGQDLFASGVIKSSTDFQVYQEVSGLSGLDFAYADNTAVYHTKNDKIELLKPGSLQHLGENVLAFLIRAASSSNLPNNKELQGEEKSNPDSAIYFDILGKYMVVYRQSFGTMLHNSVIMQSLLILVTSLFMGGYSAVISLLLSCLSIIFALIFSVAFSVSVAFILPLISSSPVPFASHPWLAVGLFVSPSILGSITGQHLTFLLLQKNASRVYSKRKQLSPVVRADLAKLDAERWLFKAGSIQWLVLLALGTYYKIGSAYLALVWLVPPAFAYGLLEATLTPARLPRPLKFVTLLFGLAVPVLVSSASFIRLAGTMIGMLIRFDRNPGGTPEWLGSVMVAVIIATFVTLTMVYLLSYVHHSGAKRSVVAMLCIITGLSLALVSSGTIPAFTEDTARAVNVVHVVDTTKGQDPISYVSLFSYTPGNLNMEAEKIGEGFTCGKERNTDFVGFEATYSCVTEEGAGVGWDEGNIPTMRVLDDDASGVSIDTRGSSRWVLAINMEEIEDFTLEAEDEVLVPRGGKKASVDGWHTVQFAGGRKAPRRFVLRVLKGRKGEESEPEKRKKRPLLKLRTDFNRATPKVEDVLRKLPPWCSLFGKSTSPYTLAFLASLPAGILG